MTDPLALAPILPPEERPTRSSTTPPHPRGALSTRSSSTSTAARSRRGDWMPDEYRESVLRFVEMHANPS